VLRHLQKSTSPADPAMRLPTVPRARAQQCPRAGPWITAADLTKSSYLEKVTHVLHHAHWTDMV
jgi:hypothetical protein